MTIAPHRDDITAVNICNDGTLGIIIFYSAIQTLKFEAVYPKNAIGDTKYLSADNCYIICVHPQEAEGFSIKISAEGFYPQIFTVGSVQSKEKKIYSVLIAENIESDKVLFNSKLTVQGKNIYGNSQKFKKNEVRKIMANTDALRLYNKGISKNNAGDALITVGSIVLATGITINIIDNAKSVNWKYYDEKGNQKYFTEHYLGKAGYIISWTAIATGATLLIPGITLKVQGKNYINKSVKIYNERTIAELKCNFTGNGVHLTLNF